MRGWNRTQGPVLASERIIFPGPLLNPGLSSGVFKGLSPNKNQPFLIFLVLVAAIYLFAYTNKLLKVGEHLYLRLKFETKYPGVPADLTDTRQQYFIMRNMLTLSFHDFLNLLHNPSLIFPHIEGDDS